MVGRSDPRLDRYKLLLFDRDGTLNFEDAGYHQDLADVKSYPFTGKTLRQLAESGNYIGIVTNQSGIGRGFWTRAEVDQLHQRLCTEWQLDIPFFICPHRPDDNCNCRKPKGSLVESAMDHFSVGSEQTLYIGDSATDFGAAESAGVDFALVLTGRGRQTAEEKAVTPKFVLNTIADLVV